MGLEFSKPSRKSLRREAEERPEKVFSIEELAKLYAAADAQMRTFILLGLNCGFGNSDVGQLKFRHVKGDVIEFPRPKTLIERTCPLWPETVEAIAKTKQTKHPSQPYVFLTLFGGCWHKDSKASPLSASSASSASNATCTNLEGASTRCAMSSGLWPMAVGTVSRSTASWGTVTPQWVPTTPNGLTHNGSVLSSITSTNGLSLCSRGCAMNLEGKRLISQLCEDRNRSIDPWRF